MRKMYGVKSHLKPAFYLFSRPLSFTYMEYGFDQYTGILIMNWNRRYNRNTPPEPRGGAGLCTGILLIGFLCVGDRRVCSDFGAKAERSPVRPERGGKCTGQGRAAARRAGDGVDDAPQRSVPDQSSLFR